MIHTLSIHNYQSHKETHLVLSKGINVIVGVTDSGKSSILRAVEWAAKNQPSTGDPSWWSKGKMEVELGFDDCIVRRIKKGASNLYELEYPNTDGEMEKHSFKSFRTEVPEEIQTAINMGPVNWQGQYDSHFLLSDTAGEVARRLNEVAHLEDIDITTSNLSGMIRTNNAKIEVLEEQDLPELREQVQQYSYLERLEKLVEKQERLQNKQQKLVENKAHLHGILCSIKLKKTLISRAENVLRIREEVEKLVLLVEEQEKIHRVLSDLESLLSEVWRYKTKVTDLEEHVKERKAKLKETMPDVCPLCEQEIST